jgi:hypothetical protein
MSPAGKRKLADFAVASFRNGRIHLYRDDALLVQVSRLPIRSVNDSYFTLDTLEAPLPLGMAFAVSLRWACGTLMATAA